MELVAPGAGWSDVHAESIAVVFRQELKRFSLDCTVRASAVDDGLRLDVRIPDLVESLARLLERVRRNQRFAPAS